MNMVGIEVFPLRIPFVRCFQHASKIRAYSDSIVIKLHADDGTTGYGEAVARPYVTGETVSLCLNYIQRVLWPAVRSFNYPEIKICSDPIQTLAPIENSLPDPNKRRVVAWHGVRAAFEIALLDLLLKRQQLAMKDVLPPKRSVINYSGVIGLGSIEQTRQVAERFRDHGLTEYKCKVAKEDIRLRLREVRRVIGAHASLRMDANCALDSRSASEALYGLEQFNVACVEQPTPRINAHRLATLQQSISIPIMADESLITITDAGRLIAAKACQWFNLRIAKFGGLINTLRIARLATAAGVRIQLGCQVGETAILSAAGRHLAAHLAKVEFVEGSYGSNLLEQDIAESAVQFGLGGKAPLIQGLGMGVRVIDAIIRKYANQIITLGEV